MSAGSSAAAIPAARSCWQNGHRARTGRNGRKLRSPRPRWLALPVLAARASVGEGYEVSFHFDPYVLDGRFANNSWLQELPRPMSRLTWDNAVIVSDKTAKDLDVTDEDRVEISVNGKTVWGSIWRVPGQPDGSLGLTLGFGRTRSGRAGNGAGFDANPLRTIANPYTASGAKVKK